MKSRQFENSQKGFVSIIVCMIIMTILSLITIGFAQVMSREQRQALDRQLSSQAFYAAESGVNDALLDVSLQTNTLSENNCAGSARDLAPGSANGVRISCVTASDEVDDIRSDIPANPIAPRIYPLRTDSDLTTLQIRWSPTVSTGTAFRPTGSTQTLPPLSEWTYDTGALNVFLLVYQTGSGRRALIDDMAQVVIMPVLSGSALPGATSYANIRGSNKGLIANANCSTSTCSFNITGLPNYDDLAIAVTSLYRPSNVIIDGTDSAGASQRFRDAQVIIDSTGRTSDVVRRIQIRRAINGQGRVATGALVVDGPGGVCKRLLTAPNYLIPVTGQTVLGSSFLETCPPS